MSILDKIRPHPEWKHEDPTVRVAAVRQLADDEDTDEILLEISRSDVDAKVRQVAVERLDDLEALTAIVREEADEMVRATATAILVDLVATTNDVAIGVTALKVLTDQRDLSDVARAAEHESIAREALTRVTEAKLLGGLARRAGYNGVRLEALSRLSPDETGELIAVAIKSDHKDVALAAFSRLAETPPSNTDAAHGLATIALRAKNKIVARRAKAVVKEREIAAGADADSEAKRQELCERVEGLGGSEDWSVVIDGLREAESAWSNLGGADQSEDGYSNRFVTAVTVLEKRIDEHHRSQADEALRRKKRAEEAAPRVTLCECVERAEGKEVPAEVESAKTAWDVLPPAELLSVEESSGLTRRFDDGCASALRRHEMFSEILSWRHQVEKDLELIEAKVAAGALDEVSSIWPSLKKGWPRLEGSWTEGLRGRVHAINDALHTKKEAIRASETERRRINLSRLTQRCDQLEALTVSPAMTLKQVERGYRDVSKALEHTPALPTKHDRTSLEARLKALQKMLHPKLHELREIESWRRWANVNVQEKLCQRVEALADREDLAEVARELREVVTQWKNVATVPRERAAELWQRFKTAHDQAYARCATYFAEQAEARKANLVKKIALCEQVEALVTSTDWLKTAARIVELQAEWKAIGGLPRKHSQATWKRFRGACDQFFERRKANLSQQKEVWAKNYSHKEALCKQAEALAESADAEAVKTVRRYEMEWRRIGPVKRSKSDAIWRRFRVACTKVSERLTEQEEARLADQIAAREALCASLEALLSPESVAKGEASPTPPEDMADQVSAVRRQWRQADGLSEQRARQLNSRFHDSIGMLVERFPEAFRDTDLDPEVGRQRMELLCERIENLLVSDKVDTKTELSPAELLASSWRETLAANTMGAKVDPAAERRANVEEAKRVQLEWKRLPPSYGEEGKRITKRFTQACDRFFAQSKRASTKPSRQAG